MKFVNNKEPRQVRFGDAGKHWFRTVRNGEEVDLPFLVGQEHGFDLVEDKPIATEGKAGTKTVETKQKEIGKKKLLEKSLGKIKGIGRKTVQDIISIYPTEEDLKEAIETGEPLPFRDDVVDSINKKYGKK